MDKPNLLLLHGALGNRDQFLNISSLLSKHFQVWSMNFSGHSGEPFDSNFSLELFVKDVNFFLRQNKIPSVRIFGYSMGGYVAMKFASQYPDKVSGIITLGTKLNWTSEFAKAEVLKLDAELIELKVPKLASILINRYSAHLWKKVVQQTASFLYTLGQGKGLNDDDLKNIECPVLICRGNDDVMVEQNECMCVVLKLIKGHYNNIENGHHLYERYDAPVLVNLIKHEFLNLV